MGESLHTGGVTGSIPVAPTNLAGDLPAFSPAARNQPWPQMMERDTNTRGRLAPSWHRLFILSLDRLWIDNQGADHP